MRRLAVCLLGMVLSLPASADLACRGAVWGQALYWKPVDQSYGYLDVIRDSVSLTHDLLTIRATDDWGVRAGGSLYLCPDQPGLVLQGLYLRSTDRTDFRRDVVFQVFDLVLSGDDFILGPVSSAARLRVTYWNVDLLGRFGCCLMNRLRFWVDAGARYVNFRTNISALIAGPESFVTVSRVTGQRQLAFWGVGPEGGVGFGLEPIGWCVGFRGHARVMAILGPSQMDVRARGSANNNPFRLDLPRITVVAPGFDGELALNAKLAYGCSVVEASVGYGLHYYWNLLMDPVRLPLIEDTWRPRNAGAGGPFVAISASF